jgi:alpha-galactosidase
MATICFLGAGSGFVEPLTVDLMHVRALDGSRFRLVDVDPERLALSRAVADRINSHFGRDWTIEAYTDRRKALRDCDYIINCIEVAGLPTVRADNDIPLKYGVSQCIGDTIGPGGLFKALRTIPVWLDVLKDCEELCPLALVLNYTNPMNMMCLAADRSSFVRVVGLCHSVQGTSRQLAGYAGVPYEEMEWRCAGINHMAWFTELWHRDRDLYPVLRERAQSDPEIYEQDPVRFDMMLHFGAFVTESSGHLSEYLPYYRKRPELIREYCRDGYRGGESFYADNWPTWRADADERRRGITAGDQAPRFERSHEYASYILEAIETNRPYVIHGNVPNDGLIENLPQDGCVEVACLVDRNGIQPTHFGRLPPQLAALCASNMAVFDLGVTAIVEQSKEAAIHALMLDPLTAAVCSPAEIRRMFEEMYEAGREYVAELT